MSIMSRRRAATVVIRRKKAALPVELASPAAIPVGDEPPVDGSPAVGEDAELLPPTKRKRANGTDNA